MIYSPCIRKNIARSLSSFPSSSCSDSFYDLSPDNEQFCADLAKWTFRERGILRMRNLESHKVGEEHIGQPYMYRVMDDIVFKIDIEEYSDGVWRPFRRPDIQLEFVMMDPYERMFLDMPKDDGRVVYVRV